MPLVVVGSVAFDSVETPQAVRERVLGGSAVYFSLAARFFTTVRLVGVVGEDWPAEYTALLHAHSVDTAGLQVVPGAKTFFWRGRYHANMNERETLDVQLNVMANFNPVLSEELRRCKFLFLANGSTKMQLNVLSQCVGPMLTVADTMDHWIRTEPQELRELMGRVDGLVLNDSEAKLLAERDSLLGAGRALLEMGPRFIVIKKGEHGALFFSKHEMYVLPAYPTDRVVDPTGAGDSFAGGMMGYLAEQADYTPETLKRAMAYGIVAASFTVEDFSVDRLLKITREDVELRMEEYRRMLTF